MDSNTFEEEDIADELIRAAAQFRQEEHMQFKVRKSLIASHQYWGVSFILCEPEEGYSLVEDRQP